MVGNPHTYFIDLMFIINKLTYLVCIGENTRYPYVQDTNYNETKGPPDSRELSYWKDGAKGAVAHITALEKIRNDIVTVSGSDPKILVGDGEGAFNGLQAKRYYEQHGIRFQTVERIHPSVYPDFMQYQRTKTHTQPKHASLSILDRVVRTIRDMAYQMQI
jgi:hypothetical protein